MEKCKTVALNVLHKRVELNVFQQQPLFPQPLYRQLLPPQLLQPQLLQLE